MIKDYKTSQHKYIDGSDWLDEDDLEERFAFSSTLDNGEDEPEDEEPILDEEAKLALFRERTREAEEEAQKAAYQKRLREKKADRFMLGLVSFTIACSLLALLLLYLTNYEYTTYSVDSSVRLGSASGARMYPFGDGCIVVGSDAVTYLLDGTVSWTASIGVTDPIFAAEGAYFVVSGRDSYQFHIFDGTGLLSTVKVSRKIRGLDISAAGVVAVCTESSDTAYVSYFDRYGGRISVEVKTVLDASGYPIRISISPDGQKLLVVYYSIANGIGESRLLVYDFKNGKHDRSYVVATYEDFYDENIYLADCGFIDDRHAVAVGDKALYFLSDFEKGNVVRHTVELTDRIRSMQFISDGLFVTFDRDSEVECVRYNASGDVVRTFTVPGNYDSFVVNTRSVVFLRGSAIKLYNLSGVLRYEGDMIYEAEDVVFSGRSSLLFNTGSLFEKITLK